MPISTGALNSESTVKEILKKPINPKEITIGNKIGMIANSPRRAEPNTRISINDTTTSVTAKLLICDQLIVLSRRVFRNSAPVNFISRSGYLAYREANWLSILRSTSSYNSSVRLELLFNNVILIRDCLYDPSIHCLRALRSAISNNIYSWLNALPERGNSA